MLCSDLRNPSEKTGTMPMPVVLQSPLRPDLVREVHRDLAKNKRRPVAPRDPVEWGRWRQVDLGSKHQGQVPRS